MQAKKNLKKTGMSDAQLEESARLFGVLSEPARLRILRALMAGPLTVTDLIEATGLKQGNVSKHLGLLADSAFVAREKDGNFARYSIADQNIFSLCELMCCRIQQQAEAKLKWLTADH